MIKRINPIKFPALRSFLCLPFFFHQGIDTHLQTIIDELVIQKSARSAHQIFNQFYLFILFHFILFIQSESEPLNPSVNKKQPNQHYSTNFAFFEMLWFVYVNLSTPSKPIAKKINTIMKSDG